MKRTLEITIIALALCLGTAAHSEDKESADVPMTLHHMHIMINHAVEMAAEGSNLVMIDEMDMAKGVDALSIRLVSHGRQMVKHAKSLLEEIMKGDAMGRLHKEGKTPETSREMAYTHDLAKAAMSYVDLLSRMPHEPGTNIDECAGPFRPGRGSRRAVAFGNCFSRKGRQGRKDF
jgi:hypothetical protein